MARFLSSERIAASGRKVIRWCATGFTIAALGIAGQSKSATPSPAAGGAVSLDTTSNTYVLFLDMQEVESMKNVERVVNHAEKSAANPVLPTGDMSDYDFTQASTWGGNVIFDKDENVFKMWYCGARSGMDSTVAVGYAWSNDGVYWHKPKLGLYEFNGTKDNNICWRSPTGTKVFGIVQRNWTDHFTAFKDYRETDPQKRYKGLSIMYVPAQDKNLYYPLYSPDGIHWTKGPNPVPQYPNSDIGNAFIDDEDPNPDRRIKIYGHQNAGYGPDIEHCIPNPNNPVIDGLNKPDPNKDGPEDTIHLSAVLHYKGYYIMVYDADFWMEYYGYKGKADIRHRDARVPEPKTGIFTGDTRLAVNRDGVSHFVRVDPYQSVIARGKRGDWDGGFIVAAPGPVVRGDKIYLFYTAVEEIGGIVMPQWEEKDDPFAIRTGVATLRLDGFTDLQTRDGLSDGTVTTKPISVKQAPQARLVVNASKLLPYRDWIEVEVLDASANQPIAGYGRRDCDPLFEEGIRIPVSWGQHKTLDGVQSPSIKLQFHIFGQAKLYSFHFE